MLRFNPFGHCDLHSCFEFRYSNFGFLVIEIHVSAVSLSEEIVGGLLCSCQDRIFQEKLNRFPGTGRRLREDVF